MQVISSDSGTIADTSFRNKEVANVFLEKHKDKTFILKIQREGKTSFEELAIFGEGFDLGDILVHDFRNTTTFVAHWNSKDRIWHPSIYFKQYTSFCGAVVVYGMRYETQPAEFREVLEDLLFGMGYNAIFHNVIGDSKEIEDLGFTIAAIIYNRRTRRPITLVYKSLVK